MNANVLNYVELCWINCVPELWTRNYVIDIGLFFLSHRRSMLGKGVVLLVLYFKIRYLPLFDGSIFYLEIESTETDGTFSRFT